MDVLEGEVGVADTGQNRVLRDRKRLERGRKCQIAFIVRRILHGSLAIGGATPTPTEQSLLLGWTKRPKSDLIPIL